MTIESEPIRPLSDYGTTEDDIRVDIQQKLLNLAPTAVKYDNIAGTLTINLPSDPTGLDLGTVWHEPASPGTGLGGTLRVIGQ